MKLLVCLGHPAHYHLYKNALRHFQEKGEVRVLIKDKDILEDLLKSANLDYVKLITKERRRNPFGIAASMIERAWLIGRHVREFKPDIMAGSGAEIAQVGRFLGVPAIMFGEDDLPVLPEMGWLGWTFARHLVSPECTEKGRWAYKTIKYKSYHELAYLHPNHFEPDIEVVKRWLPVDKPYFILRFAKLAAYHDAGRKGLTADLATKVIDILEKRGRVYITAERELEPEFESYRLPIDPLDIHHVMAFSDLYLGDSQTMAAEAAVLGVPSIRFNDFIGQIGYLEDLEHNYRLTCGIPTSEPETMLRKVEELSRPGVKEEWAARREAMLEDKIDFAAFMIWFLETYPESVKRMREDSSCQFRLGSAGAPESEEGVRKRHQG